MGNPKETYMEKGTHVWGITALTREDVGKNKNYIINWGIWTYDF